MLRLFKNYLRLMIFLLYAILFISCGFLDFRPIELIIEPDQSGSLLPDHYSPVKLKFNTEMVKKEAEGILQISSDSGVINGDKFWEGNDLVFIPVSGWTAGTYYTLSLTGTLRSTDGRDLRLEKFISFYAVKKCDPPILKYYSPENFESTRINNFIPEFHFSCSMDRLSVESALSIDGITNKKFEWSNADTVLKINFDKDLSPWTVYKWNIKTSAKSTDGVPLPISYSACFITDIDQTFPFVKKVFPVINTDGLWYPTGLDIETGLGYDHGVAVEFSKTMGESVLRSIRFEPALSGKTESLNETSIAYIFSSFPEPDTHYTIIISGDTKDSEGLKIGNDYRIVFTPNIPVLKILTFRSDNDPDMIYDLSTLDYPPVIKINPSTDDFNFSIGFSLPIDENEKQNLVLKISLDPFFPKTINPIALQYVEWISVDRLFMRWEGLQKGSVDMPNYYKITIPGGKSGISAGKGIYMKEDISFMLEAVLEAVND